MINLAPNNIIKVSNEFSFIKDNVEKVMRLISILEIIFSSKWKDKFALKGGTAINLFYTNMSRLSVDIDLDYLGITKEEMMLDRVSFSALLKNILSKYGYECMNSSKNYYALDSFVFRYTNNAGNIDIIKVEINYLNRIHLLPCIKMNINTLGYNGDTLINVLDLYELYGSKIAALIGRGKPRDVFDVSNAIDSNLFKNKELLKKCFIFYNCIGGKADCIYKDYALFEKVSRKDYLRMLRPMLKKGENFNIELSINKIKSFLEELLMFTTEEIEFVNSFLKKDYAPMLLFDGEYANIAIKILNHPMAQWRCKLEIE